MLDTKASAAARVRRRQPKLATALGGHCMHRVRILAAVSAALFSGSVLADNYPTKPITIITAFGPGSASDTITRVVAQSLSVALKQSVIVEAKPGASGALSALYVARQPADGYTLLMTTNSPHSAAPYLM